MLTNQTRWSLGHGKPLVPSRWQATESAGQRGAHAGSCDQVAGVWVCLAAVVCLVAAQERGSGPVRGGACALAQP
jgi:hypothetical protein